ncbi:amino acid adenylation domain-containing protein [Micromonospora sp. AMSO12t]|uniref:non-ribosomal peptide synthetase n=1 Tax=Micromonospora sp. AMSO12t TaxID=2650410 RepID=UPI00124AE69A|nr:non-ribosomal peptide synthetase [Micromonospora sp. AMSO12t]KAB1162082.1 amino acid adenylation domain-containing protein [Micromonospora sp. AMSO12t]
MMADSLSASVETHAARAPEAIAVIDSSRELTYSQLDAEANVIAAELRRLGVGPEQFVGILMNRSAEYVVGTLAILKAGAAYVPLSPADPAARIELLLADVAAPVVLVDDQTADLVSGAPGVVTLNVPAVLSQRRSASFEPPPFHGPDQACYVIFTSGSTGKPKGVVISHRNVLGLTGDPRWTEEACARVLVHCPCNFDASTAEQWVALTRGTTLVVAPPGILEPADLGRVIAEHQVTTVLLTTGLFNVVVAEHAEILRNTRLLWTAGDRASTAAVLRAREVAPQAVVYNGYGPTEATVLSTIQQVTSDQSPDRAVPIGSAMADKTVHILGPDLREVPEGEVGELHVGGGGLARGYLRQPALTAERFIPDPFGPPGARLYRTGDLARRLPDRSIDFVGRRDNQVKLRGFRIELGEIETVVGGHPGVREVVVVVREEQPGRKQLVAYVVADPVADLTPASLRRAVAKQLPSYMVPLVMMMDALPLTSNQKVDRAALPAPDLSSGSAVTFDSALEREVAEVVGELLGVPSVGPEDGFYEIGGDSLLAMRVAARLRRRLGVDHAAGVLLRGGTIREVVRRSGAARPQPDPVPVVDRELPMLPSFGQERLWYLDQANPDSREYVLPLALRLRGALDPTALGAALRAVLARHEALRTGIVEVDGEPRQVIAPAGAVPEIACTDLRHLGGEALAEARALARRQAGTPFDLGAPPMIRTELVRLADDDHLLLLAMHHIAADAWSLAVLAGELAVEYRAAAEGEPSMVPPPPVQYADFAAWQRDRLSGERLETGVRFWADHLAGAPPSALPTDRPRPPLRSSEGGEVQVCMPAALVAGLRRLGLDHDATMFMVVMAVFHLFLARYSGQSDVVTGTAVANRPRPEFEALIGFFTNTIALRSQVHAGDTFPDLLAQVRETALGAFAYQDVPLERVVERVAPPRDPSRHPIFQIMLVVQNAPAPSWKLGAVRGEEHPLAEEAARFDLTLYADEVDAGMRLRFVYARDLFDVSTVRRMAENFLRLAESVVASPGVTVADLDMLTSSEARQIAEYAGTSSAGPTVCAHQMVEAVAARLPDAVAVECGDARLTYGELQRRSTELCHVLWERGVQPEDRVGLWMRRGVDTVVGLLGILKSGATYVPFDEDLPAARISGMAADAQLSVLVGDESAPPLAPLVRLDHLPPAPPPYSAGPTPGNVAYLVFTSGSTGRPKGVMGTHGGLANYLHYTRGAYDLTQRDVVLQLPSLAYDASLRDILAPLAAGARVVLLPFDVPKTPETVREAIDKHGVTALLSTVPSMLREFELLGNRRPRSLRLVVSSGESMRLAGAWPQDGALAVLNQYGPTECTMTTTVRRCDGPSDVVGRPIPNAHVLVLDGRLHPVPLSVPGELYIAGAGLARGYLGRPGETAGRFIPNPYGAPGDRMYRTGDQVRLLGDGELEFLGRIDRQLKIRGNRVEPGEIEAVLASHPSVARAGVRLCGDVDAVLVAYVEPATGGAPPTSTALRTHLAVHLPDHMIPAAFAVLDPLPTTVSGKIDYRALPDGVPERPDAEHHVPPRNGVERKVAAIWCELLGLERVGVHDEFFALGGHSLLATRVVSRLKRAFKLELTVLDFLNSPTVAGVAEVLADAHAARMRALFGPAGQRSGAGVETG